MRLLRRPDSEAIAKKMLMAMGKFSEALDRKSNKTAAEKRHLMRLRATGALKKK